MTNPNVTAHDGLEADPIERLTRRYENPAAEALAAAANGTPVVGITSIPCLGSWSSPPAPFLRNQSHEPDPPDIGNFMEEGVFEDRIRAIFGAAISGDLHYLSLLLIPGHPNRNISCISISGKLHARIPEGPFRPCTSTTCSTPGHPNPTPTAWNVRGASSRLEALAGKTIERADLLQAIRESNAARRAIRNLLSLRKPEAEDFRDGSAGMHRVVALDAQARICAPGGGGVEADRDPQPPGRGQAAGGGASLHHRGLHLALERHGAVVVAEDDWWGSRSSGRN